jgi:hypothetical protein
MPNQQTPELLLNYPAENLEMTAEEMRFILDRQQDISTFFGFDVRKLSFIELLSLGNGMFLNKFRELNEGESILHVVDIEPSTMYDIKLPKHKHYNRVKNIGEGFLAVKCFDPEPVVDIRLNKTYPIKIRNNFIVDPYDNLLRLNDIEESQSFQTHMEIDLAKKQIAELRQKIRELS